MLKNALALLICAIAFAGCEKHDAKVNVAPGGVKVSAPGVEVNTNDHGANVVAPGVNVKAGDAGTDVTAPGVNVKANP